MKKKDFKKLSESVRQAGKVRRGKMKPGRVIKFDAVDIKKIRHRLNKSQSEFAMMIGVSISTL